MPFIVVSLPHQARSPPWADRPISRRAGSPGRRAISLLAPTMRGNQGIDNCFRGDAGRTTDGPFSSGLSSSLKAGGELQGQGLEGVVLRHVGVHLAFVDVERPAVDAQPAVGDSLLDPGKGQEIRERGPDRLLLEDAQLRLERLVPCDDQGAPARLVGDLQPLMDEGVLLADRGVLGQKA
jgi:hypothetical protein